MSRRDPLVLLRHMLDYAQEAVSLIKGKSRADLESDRLLNLALVRLLEVVGEAASRIHPEERERYPEIPWPQIIGMRNRLIHGYDMVDYDILWATVVGDLPPLIILLERTLERK